MAVLSIISTVAKQLKPLNGATDMKALAYNYLEFGHMLDLHDFLENAGVQQNTLTVKATKALFKREGLQQKGAACIVLSDEDAAVATAAVLKFPEVRVFDL